MQEAEILDIIKKDQWRMEILRIVRDLDLPDACVGAGFIRSKIWDTLHGFEKAEQLTDIDLLYFDPINISETIDWELEDKLNQAVETKAIPWEVRNQARMHLKNGCEPYTSTIDAIAHFPEIATSIGVRMLADDSLELLAPYGIDDLVNLRVRPTPYFAETTAKYSEYKKRIAAKYWQEKWPKIVFIEANN